MVIEVYVYLTKLGERLELLLGKGGRPLSV